VVNCAVAVAQGPSPFWGNVVERPQPMRPIVGEFTRREDGRWSNNDGLGACKGASLEFENAKLFAFNGFGV